MHTGKRYLFTLGTAFLFFPSIADANAPAKVDVRPAFPKLPPFERPVDFQVPVAYPQDAYVVEQKGVITTFPLRPDAQRTTVLDIRGRVLAYDDQGGGNEEGLLGLAFHPHFADNGYFYVNYTTRSTKRAKTEVTRF